MPKQSEDRGKLSGLLQFMLSWGFFIAQWLGFGCFKVNSDFQWRFPLSFQVVPGLIMACGIWLLQESPRWLIEKDRLDEARLSLRKLHGTGDNDEFLDLEYREIRDTIIAEKAVAVKSWSTILTKASWRRRLLLGCGIQAFGQLSGINVSALREFLVYVVTIVWTGDQLLWPSHLQASRHRHSHLP